MNLSLEARSREFPVRQLLVARNEGSYEVPKNVGTRAYKSCDHGSVRKARQNASSFVHCKQLYLCAIPHEVTTMMRRDVSEHARRVFLTPGQLEDDADFTWTLRELTATGLQWGGLLGRPTSWWYPEPVTETVFVLWDKVVVLLACVGAIALGRAGGRCREEPGGESTGTDRPTRRSKTQMRTRRLYSLLRAEARGSPKPRCERTNTCRPNTRPCATRCRCSRVRPISPRSQSSSSQILPAGVRRSFPTPISAARPTSMRRW